MEIKKLRYNERIDLSILESRLGIWKEFNLDLRDTRDSGISPIESGVSRAA